METQISIVCGFLLERLNPGLKMTPLGKFIHKVNADKEAKKIEERARERKAYRRDRLKCRFNNHHRYCTNR